MQLYGIIGHPLGHTMSPTLHNWGFQHAGLDARYEIWDTLPENLPVFVQRMRDEKIQGVSVTIPHKQAVMKLVDKVSTRANAVGAANTLFWKNGDLRATNTDIMGVLRPLKELETVPASAILLGAGGAARAAVAALNEFGVEHITITNRDGEKAKTLAAEFGVHHAPWEERHRHAADLFINSTPLGMRGTLEDANPWPLKALPQASVVFDLVYNPLETPLLRCAKQSGCQVISGLEMFLHQGLKQFKLWTGLELDAEKARAVLLNALT